MARRHFGRRSGRELASVLDVPASERPQFITMYFDMVDNAGHHEGPMFPKLIEAVKQVDVGIGRSWRCCASAESRTR